MKSISLFIARAKLGKTQPVPELCGRCGLTYHIIHSKKRRGVIILPPPTPDGMLVHCKVPLPPAFHQIFLIIRRFSFILLGRERQNTTQ